MSDVHFNSELVTVLCEFWPKDKACYQVEWSPNCIIIALKIERLHACEFYYQTAKMPIFKKIVCPTSSYLHYLEQAQQEWRGVGSFRQLGLGRKAECVLWNRYSKNYRGTGNLKTKANPVRSLPAKEETWVVRPRQDKWGPWGLVWVIWGFICQDKSWRGFLKMAGEWRSSSVQSVSVAYCLVAPAATCGWWMWHVAVGQENNSWTLKCEVHVVLIGPSVLLFWLFSATYKSGNHS